MIYFDNAATTYPKPPSVIRAAVRAFEEFGANPGRAGHKFSAETAEAVFKSRQKCADFFGAEVENTAFTLNCTLALNMAIKGVLYDGSHIITSDLEHNAVIRPIHAWAKHKGAYSIAKAGKTDRETLKNFEELIMPNTSAIVCTAASNVTGQRLPLAKIGAVCRKFGICFIVDAAQGAGIFPIILADDINIICAAGHKGLYGPMGTGLIVTDGKFPLKSIIEGGTGSLSSAIEQPDFMPDMLESGTINTPGVIALGAGIDFVVKKGIDKIRKHEDTLCKILLDEIADNDKITVYRNNECANAPVISFNIKSFSSEELAAKLSDKGFCLRGGLHCAFLAHSRLGTLNRGAVRFAPSYYNTAAEVYEFAATLNRI